MHDLPVLNRGFGGSQFSDLMSQANAQIAAIIKKDRALCYFDVASPMLDGSGNAKPELFVDDGLHMNAKGYRIWTEVVRPQVEAMYNGRSTP